MFVLPRRNQSFPPQVLWTALNFGAPFLSILIGSLMAKTPDSPTMGLFGWWLVAAIALGASGSFSLWIWRPASQGSNDPALEVWYFCCSLVLWTATLISLLVYDGARCNLYPYKEERIMVEGFTKLLFNLMVGIYVGMVLVYLTAPSRAKQLVNA